MNAIAPEVQYALMISVIGALGTLIIFLWGMVDLKDKFKKLDKIDGFDSIVNKLDGCVTSLHDLVRRQDVSEAISKREFIRLAQDMNDLKMRVWHLEKKAPREGTPDDLQRQIDS